MTGHFDRNLVNECNEDRERKEAMSARTDTTERIGTIKKTKAMAAGLLAPAPAHASAFPGANGKIAFASSRSTGTGVNNPEGDLEIFSMNPDGTGLKQLTKNKETDEIPSYSADGKNIVFHGQRAGNFDIFSMNADGTGKKNLTDYPASDLRPSFSPDGKNVLFDSDRNGPGFNEDVFVMNADGTGQTPLTANVAFSDEDPSFSPDGNKIAFASDRFGGGDLNDYDVLVMGADGSNPTNFTGSRAKNDSPAFSPDGKKIAFVSTRDGTDPDVFVMDAVSGAGQTDITPDWQPVAATFTVNSASDSADSNAGDGVCDADPAAGAPCTLRAAIQEANASAVADTIKFDIPGGWVQNLIGTTASGTAPLGNGDWGVVFFNDFTSNNKIGDGTGAGSNTIAFNGRDGIEVDFGSSATGNTISRNSIFSNGSLGIDLIGGSETEDTDVPTTNDTGDADTGPNSLQNKPVLTSAKTGTSTTITGKLNSTPAKTYTLQFFSNPSGGDEGKTFIGQKSVTTDASGNATFTFSPASKVAAGQTITATATKASTGDTSEFSAPRTVVLASGSALSLETTKISGPSGVTKSPAAHFKFSSPDPAATFECSLDGGAYYPCSSPENINRLSEDRHAFEVRAVGGGGNTDPSPAAWIWAVDKNR